MIERRGDFCYDGCVCDAFAMRGSLACPNAVTAIEWLVAMGKGMLRLMRPQWVCRLLPWRVLASVLICGEARWPWAMVRMVAPLGLRGRGTPHLPQPQSAYSPLPWPVLASVDDCGSLTASPLCPPGTRFPPSPLSPLDSLTPLPALGTPQTPLWARLTVRPMLAAAVALGGCRRERMVTNVGFCSPDGKHPTKGFFPLWGGSCHRR